MRHAEFMTNIERSGKSPDPNTFNASQSGSAGPPAVVGSSTSAQQPPHSYAHATKKSISGVTPDTSGAPLIVGGNQNGKGDALNGRTTAANMAPTIVNSGGAPNGQVPLDHSRKPSVTISAAGASGQMPNGAPTAPASRPNINFGSMNAASGSPAIANSNANHNLNSSSSLPAPTSDPRITSPAASPTPIPTPAASGGKPPDRPQAQANGLSFGNMSGTDGQANRHMQGPSPMVGGPNTHFRRTSSHSYQGDAGGMPMNAGPNRGGGYMGGPRGRGYNANYQHQQMQQYSPSPGFRQMTPQRSSSGIPPHMNMVPHPGSPHGAPRSPAPMGSQPSTPHMQPMQIQHGQPMYPTYSGYAQQLQGQPGQFGMQPNYQEPYNYYNQPYPVHPHYLPPPPQSPRNAQRNQQPPQMSHQQYGQAQYPPPPSQNMSRTSSQISERPASSIGSAQPPVQPSTTPAMSQSSHAHSQSNSANFQIPPKRVSKGIVIKKPDGEVVTFDSKKPAPAPAVKKTPSPVPAPPQTVATPPPRSSSTASQPHARADSKSSKSAAEIRAEFAESVRKEQEKEPTIKEGAAVPDKIRNGLGSKNLDVPIGEDKQPATKEATPDRKESVSSKAANDTTADKPSPVTATSEVSTGKGGTTTTTDTSDKDADTDRLSAQKKAEPVEEEVAETSATATGDQQETEEDRKKRESDEEMERMIAEMEAADKEEAERERVFDEKKKQEKALREKEDAEGADAKLKQAEREAEALEEARQQKKPQEEESAESNAENDKMFASLKKPDIGPGAEAESPKEPEAEPAKTPTSEDQLGAMPPPRTTRLAGAAKPKPAALKLETAKSVEPAQPTPGMRSLRSARMLQLQSEAITYPEGIQSPNPAINQSGRRGGRLYDKDFLLQFQDAFKEKPFVDWDKKVLDTLGDPSDPQKSARTPGPRTPAHRPPPPAFGVMGKYENPVGGRTIGPGSTSEQRFRESNTAGPRTMNNPMAQQFPTGFGRGGSTSGRQPSATHGGLQSSNSRTGSTRGRGQASAPGRQPNRHQQEQSNAKMPLTAGADLKPIETTQSGWKPTSVGKPTMASAPDLGGHMAPDMVQRKVKSNLNKMTPERFDKIADQILVIGAQSKNEPDGRTLRQVIALTFEKACDEAHWASMYAKFAKRMLEEMTPEIKDENVRDKNGAPVVGGALFRKYLLNRCQEEFERGWEVQLDLNGGEVVMLSDDYYKAAAAKRKGLGLVQFIGELYKLRMLSIKIMHECVKKLIDFEGDADEASIEGLCKLLRTVGGTMESEDAGPPLIKAYFDRIATIMSNKNLPSRMHFMLLDVVDLRKKRWHSKDDSKGPKTITEIHEEAVVAQQKAEQERQRNNQRGGGGRMGAGRGDARNFSNPMPPPDYAKNTLGTDDLRKLNQRKESRQAASGPSRSLGPTSMLGSRSSSGRQGFGPPGGLLSRNESGAGSSAGSSGMHSRTASIKAEKKEEEPKANTNLFSALSGMEGDTDATPASSPPATKSQPAANNDGKASEQSKLDVGSKE